ncbi:MAG: C40 family peptidase [Gemmatimonadetes bacterium]|nr:C40 family peptidase [Gemmatimonadota bacterium]
MRALVPAVLIGLLLAAPVRLASAQAAGDGAVASVLSRGANPEGPFAKRGLVASDSVVERARAQLGKRYRWAAASPERGFDCSGLVKFVLRSVGVDVPHNAARIAREGEAVNPDSTPMRPGDLLMFGRGRSTRISHVGIYVGDGRMIHASTSQRRVIEAKVPTRGSSLTLRGVRRVLRDSTTVPARAN